MKEPEIRSLVHMIHPPQHGLRNGSAHRSVPPSQSAHSTLADSMNLDHEMPLRLARAATSKALVPVKLGWCIGTLGWQIRRRECRSGKALLHHPVAGDPETLAGRLGDHCPAGSCGPL